MLLYCFYIVFITFSRPVTATTTAAVTARATAAATQSQSQPLQQSQLYCGVQNRGKTPPPKDSIKRKPNAIKKEQKMPRVRGEHFFGLWGTLSGS